ncbi:hypothetical protein [Pseudomonas tolaasii]
MNDLFKMVKSAHPNDQFFSTLHETLRISYQVRQIYGAYEQALSCLDERSWGVLSSKALDHYLDHREGQLKQGFFNQLNEAFAYQFLLREGCTNVAILQEDGTRKPDIAYKYGGELRYCEVKTIGISDDEVRRISAQNVFDATIYQELSPGFLNKLDNDLKQAHRQIFSQGNRGLVFVVARFDDFTLSHYDRYREQLLEFLQGHDAQDVFIKVDLLGGKCIHKRSGRLCTNG